MNTSVIERAEATGTVITVPESPTGLSNRQVYNRLKKISEIDAQIKELEKEKEALKTQICGDVEGMVIDCTLFSLQFKQVMTKRFDTKAFASAAPDLYEKYRKPSYSMRFTYKLK